MRTILRHRIPAALLVVATSGLPALVSAQAPARQAIGIIDVQRILAESEEGKREIAKIKQFQEQKVAQLQQMEQEVQKLKDKLTDLGFSISEDERTKLQRQIQDRMIEGDRFRSDADREIKGKFEDVFAAFEKRIFPIIEKLGPEKGVLLILNRETPGLVWADKSLDMTGDVIERFNRMSAGSAKGN